MRAFHSILLVMTLSGCITMGGVADHVDPEEAQLVKRLTSELCKVNFQYQGEIVKTETVRASFVGVADIVDISGDEGRLATVAVKGNEQSFSYNPVTAMAYCGNSSARKGGFVYYDRVSETLIERGGNPDIYIQRKAIYDASLKAQEARTPQETRPRQSRVLDATFPIRAQWEGVAETIYGSIREVRVGEEGTMVVTLPESLGICTGDYQYTGHNVGTWALACPNDLTATGTFKSGKGAHGEGVDNKGRKITYTIQVPG